MEARTVQKSTGVQVIARAADILRLLGEVTNGLSLSQIASHVNLPRSTVQRIVSALAEEGLVANTNEHGTIRLGPAIQKLAMAQAENVVDRIRPLMRALSEETGETVDLAVLENNKIRFVDQIEGQHRLRTVSRIGEVFPLCTTANGKAALACLPTQQAEELIVAELAGARGSKIRLQRLLKELETINAGALAKDESEHTEGICALGFAMQQSNTGTIYAVSIPVPSMRYERTKKTLYNTIVAHQSKFVERSDFFWTHDQDKYIN